MTDFIGVLFMVIVWTGVTVAVIKSVEYDQYFGLVLLMIFTASLCGLVIAGPLACTLPPMIIFGGLIMYFLFEQFSSSETRIQKKEE